jgi:deoxyribonuclease (pyrimidine dimer)
MTRINANIPPKRLTDQHLLAEHREIKRICDMYSKRLESGRFDDIPEKFTLNAGHVKFFLDKGLFTHDRCLELHQECIRRGFSVSCYVGNWAEYQSINTHHNNWQATDEDNQLIIDRITQRINESNQVPRYYGKAISRYRAIEILNGK